MFILPKVESSGSQLAKGLGAGLSGGLSAIVEQLVSKKRESKENEALQRLTGQDFSGMSPDLKREFVKVFTGARSQKEQEKYKMLETGLGTIQEMRGLLESTGPMKALAGLFPGETQAKRSQFSQLGKSLIPLVSAGVSIRNQKEFDEYKKVLTDPNAQQSKIEGALDGLENLLTRQIGEKEEEASKPSKSEKLPVFDISNPSHKKARDAVLNKYGNDRERAAKELSKKFREE